MTTDRLNQQLGRLIRTHEDHGTATILGRRLVSKRLGGLLMRCLLDFELVIEPASSMQPAVGLMNAGAGGAWLPVSLNLDKEPAMASAMENVATNGQAGSVAAVHGSALAMPTLLGRTAPRIPVAGRIRAGIKVLTRRAAENERVRAIYERGVEQGKSFDSIEREIADAVPDLKNPLTPKNVPYFTLRGEDFPNPEIARQITDLFGEDRGDGMRRLYRFPVVFPADAWQTVMPHELVAWTATERRYWSEYAPDGQTRYCMSHAPVPVASGTRRAIRVWGGRKTMRRADNGGLCDPESCTEYQDRKCNLSGRFIFFIPGIKSISAFEVPTNSFYAMNAAIQKFQTIGFMRGGRISGFLDGKHTPFYLTKRLVDVPRIDDEGRPVRTSQWLIELEAPVDVAALLRPDEVLSRKLSPHPSFTQFCDDGRAILLIGSPGEGMREGEPMRAHK